MNFFKKLFDKNEVLVAKNNSKECKDEQLFIDIKDDMYSKRRETQKKIIVF